jgi:hypothetical protein
MCSYSWPNSTEWNGYLIRWACCIFCSQGNYIVQHSWWADCTPPGQNWWWNKWREHFTSTWWDWSRMLIWSSLCGGWAAQLPTGENKTFTQLPWRNWWWAETDRLPREKHSTKMLNSSSQSCPVGSRGWRQLTYQLLVGPLWRSCLLPAGPSP